MGQKHFKKRRNNDQDYIATCARLVNEQLPDGHGFVVLTFPFDGQGDNRLRYASSAKREDVVKMLKEFLFSIGGGESWMNHIN